MTALAAKDKPSVRRAAANTFSDDEIAAVLAAFDVAWRNGWLGGKSAANAARKFQRMRDTIARRMQR